MMTVWIVQVLRGATSFDTHVFSTEEKALAFMRARDEHCVLSNYEVDNPERYYSE